MIVELKQTIELMWTFGYYERFEFDRYDTGECTSPTVVIQHYSGEDKRAWLEINKLAWPVVRDAVDKLFSQVGVQTEEAKATTDEEDPQLGICELKTLAPKAAAAGGHALAEYQERREQEEPGP